MTVLGDVGRLVERLMGRNLESGLAYLLRQATSGQDPTPNHVRITRACVLRLLGQLWAVDVTFRRVEK